MIDPGPDLSGHVRALTAALAGARQVAIVLTHGHPDHAGATRALARATGAEVWGPAGIDGVDHPIGDGSTLATDAGELVAVATPGHTRDHLAFHLPARAALFAGDHLLGHGDTTWVAEYPGCVADYLRSLERLRALDLAVVYPAHGPPLTDPAEALDRFEAHRRARIRQVAGVLEAVPHADIDAVLEAVYGTTLPSGVRAAARRSLEALIDHVRAQSA